MLILQRCASPIISRSGSFKLTATKAARDTCLEYRPHDWRHVIRKTHSGSVTISPRILKVKINAYSIHQNANENYTNDNRMKLGKVSQDRVERIIHHPPIFPPHKFTKMSPPCCVESPPFPISALHFVP